ncbi:hypothetical protein [Microcystis aeruginosa]|uniref:hypothetical protein n=1 Tax=Microcystis aeruginosa TaxID=1126 RepID=UPI00132FD117|nr:hypothetical protein [Microcystis aeruginosa]
MTLKEIPVLKFNQEDDSDRTTFFGIALTAAINVHGAFPKSDLWISRTCIRERTLQERLSRSEVFFFKIILWAVSYVITFVIT